MNGRADNNKQFVQAASMALLVGTLVLSGGCAHFHSQPISPDKNAAELERRSLEAPELKSFLEKSLHQRYENWPPASWNFEMLAGAAFYYHPDLAIARIQWLVAQAGEKTAAQRPNPTLSVAPQYTVNVTEPSPWVFAANLDIPLETAGKRGYRRAQAAHLANAARLNIATVAWQVRSSVRGALLDVAAAGLRAEALQKQLAVQEQIVNRTEQQKQAGAISDAEALPFRLALSKARVDLADAQRTQAESRARLAEAIGISLHALDQAKLDFDLNRLPASAAQLTSAEIRRAALQNRADILGALEEYNASQSALQLEIAKQYPDIHLQPGYEYDQGANKWSVIGISLELPILNQNQGPIAEAEAHRQEAAAKFNALQAKVLAEIERSVQVYQSAETNLSTLQSLTEMQARRTESISAQVNAGATDQLELLNAEFESASTALLQLDGQIKLQQAFGALEDAVQRPFELPPAIFQTTNKL
jgi:outer membrane protein TolC